MGKKALVISGGGSKGAFAGGIVEYLVNVKKKNYDLYVSSSTGTLVQLIASTNNIEKLKEGYTTITNKDIWKINPFKIKDNSNGKIKMSLNWWNVIRNTTPRFKIKFNKKFPFISIEKISGNISFGDSSNLLKTIKRFMTEKEYQMVRDDLKRELVVCVVNATLKQIEYKSSTNWGYKDFCEWTKASCSAYPFMNPVVKNEYQYIDGGVLEPVPIQEAIDRGATEIDVIRLKEENPKYEVEFMRNLVHGILTEIDMMHSEVGKDDIKIGQLRANGNDVKLNIYYTPRKLTNNSLVFDKDIMTEWWKEGFEFAKKKEFKHYELSGRKKPKLISTKKS
jgi:predicted patatin/cPLA2 family phospholipase